MKIKSILIFVILGIFLATNVSAITIGYFGWEDSQRTFPIPEITDITVNQGENPNLYFYIIPAFGESFNIQILLKQEGNPIPFILYEFSNTVSQNYNIDTTGLEGNYEIELRAQGDNLDTQTIQLTVNPSTPNLPPSVTDISWDSTSGIINFEATANDLDGQVTQVSFEIYYGSNVEIHTDNTPTNGFTYDFDSIAADIHEDNNVMIIARAFDGEDWGDYLEEGPFTILNNQAPNQAININPIDGATNVQLIENLQWTGTDPNGDSLTYEVYLNNILVYQGSNTLYNPNLEYETDYSWKVDTTDEHGLTTEGNVWTFRTIDEPNQIPTGSITLPAGNQEVYPGSLITFESVANDLDGSIQTYSWMIFEGNIMVHENTNQNFQYVFNNLGTFLVRYRVEDNDNDWSEPDEVTITVIDFPNQAPNEPSNPNPANGATNVLINKNLQWTGTDPDGDILTYSVYLDNQLVYQGTNNYYNPTLDYLTTYNWYIIAYDGEYTATSEIWSFTTMDEPWENSPPFLQILTPTTGTEIEDNYEITWEATDIDQSSNTLNIKIEYKKLDLTSIKLINQIIYPLTSWSTLLNSDSNPISYNWNTNSLPNGEYRLKITVIDDNQAQTTVQVSHFMIDNFIPQNQAPVITDISGYNLINSGTINFLVTTYDANNDNIQLYFQIFYDNSWHSLDCIQNTCLFDSTVINYNNNVQVKARAYDGQEFSDWMYSTTFTVDNTVEPEEPESTVKVERHKFAIANVIPKIKSDKIELYIDLRNKGNQNEDDVTIRATVIQTGLVVYDNVDLEMYNNMWRIIQLPMLTPGTYVVNVEAYSNNYKDNRLVVLQI